MYPPTRTELCLITLIRYKALPPKGDKFTVHAINNNFNVPACDPFDVPSDYYEHVRRFLWRHQLFMEVEKRKDKLCLAVGLLPLAQRYISYMDAMIEGLFIEARRSETQGSNWWSKLFDLYLVVDRLVQGHECHKGHLWRLKNPDQVLETVDVTTLGWKHFYAAADVNDPVWTGTSYQFDTANVAEGDWQDLADTATNYLGLTNPKAKSKKGQRRC
ncbi:hypothetical protein EV401DRAFT_2076756 [Pisolithus croceorrhizus]|nr:hypothetical protein EV401DRAFT_2076756 [Pisolithus croceorrhizus]